MRKLTKISIAVSAIAVFSAVSYFAAIYSIKNFVDLNKYKTDIYKEIETKTGFKVSSEDISIKKDFKPDIDLKLYHTIVLYPDESVFLKLKDIDLRVKLLPLLFKKVVIKDAVFERPIINITLYKDFSTSIEKYTDKINTTKTAGFQMQTLISDIICKRYKVKIYDETINKTLVLEGDELVLKDIKLNDKADFILKGTLKEEEGKTEYLVYDLNITAPLKYEKRHFTFSPFEPIVDSDIKGKVYGNLKIDNKNHINGEIKINDISLKTGGTTLSGNNINLNFKGEEALIDAVIHTSLKDSAKLSGNFSFGKKKFINLNTKAKNINLENLFKVISLISESLNIKNNLKDLKVKGLLDADFNINSDFTKLKSDGSLKVINAVISHKTLPYSISGINADINLDSNNIMIQKASFFVNNTPVNIEGTIKEDLSFNIKSASENLNIVNIVNLFGLKDKIPVDIKGGKLSFTSETDGILSKYYNSSAKIKLSSVSLKEKTQDILSFINTLELNIKGSDKIYEGDILCSKISANIGNQNIGADTIKLSFDNKKITIPENEITYPFKVKFSGSVNEYKQNPSGYIDFYEDIEALKLAAFIKNFLKTPYKATGKIKTKGKITFQDNSANLKILMNANKNNYISYLVFDELLNKESVLNLDSNITKEAINIKDFSLSENSEHSKQPLFKAFGIIELPKLALKDFKLKIPGTITFKSNFSGGEEVSLNADLTLNESITRPIIDGNAKIYKLNLKKYLTAVKNADVSFSKDNIRIIAPDVQANTSYLNVILDIVPDFSQKNITVSNLQLNSLNLDLNTFFDILKNERNPFNQTIITVKKGFTAINNFKILDLKAKDVTADIALEKNILKISNINAKSYNGTVSGQAQYNLGHSNLSLNMEGKGINIRDSLYDLCGFSDNLEGTTDLKAEISLIPGTLANNVIKSMSGKVDYNAKNGKMGTLGKFEYYLYAQNLMYHGILNSTFNRIADAIVRDNTARFITSSGTLHFQNGYMITDNIQTIGTNMSIFAKGRHNLLTNQINMTIYGRISDEVKNKLGSFGDFSLSEMMNTNQENKQYVMMTLPDEIMEKIPDLYNKNTTTNTFTVNIFGDMNSLNAINSFMWVVPKQQTDNNPAQEETLPDFSDMIQNL